MTDLAAARHRLVRAVAREESPAALELFAIASDGRKSFTLTEWRAVLAALDESPLTVSEWLEARSDWL